MSAPGGGPISPTDAQRIEEVAKLAVAGDVERLSLMLDDPSWVVRRRVIGGLALLGDAAVPTLCLMLEAERRSETRIAAVVESLSAATSEDDAPIQHLLAHSDPAVVADAAQILGRRRRAANIPRLVGLFSHQDDNVAVAGIEALGRIGGRAAVDALVELLQTDNFFRIFPAIEVLGRSGDPRAVAALVRLLERPHYTREAARALGDTGERQGVPPLCSLLTHASDSVVRLAALSLATLDERYRERYDIADGVEESIRQACAGTRALDRLTSAIAQAEPAEAAGICLVLGAIGDQSAVGALTELLDRTPTVAKRAAMALRKLSGGSQSEILRALREGDSGRKRCLLPILAKSSALADVANCLDDADPAVQVLACDTLARIGDPSIVGRLFALLEDANVRVCQAATSAIQSLGSRETERLALEAAVSSQALVRRSGLRILAYFGYGSAWPVFVSALRDEDERVRSAALQGLPFIDDPRAQETLLSATRDPSARVRAAAMRSLGQCADDLRITSVLLKGITDSDAWVRYYACQSLGRMSCNVAAGPIAKLVDDPAGQVRVAAVEALSHLDDPIAQVTLERAAENEEPDVQRAALIGLGLSKTGSLGIVLRAATHPDPATRLVAVSALAAFSSPEAARALSQSATDSDESVRTAAIGVLSARVGTEATDMLIQLMLNQGEDTDKVISALSVPVEGRIAAITSSLKTADDELSPRLTSTLARMHRPDARAALVSCSVCPILRHARRRRRRWPHSVRGTR